MNPALIALSLLATVLVAPLAALTQAPEPAVGGPILVISANAEAIVQAAGARAIGPYTARFGVLADVGTDADMIDRLYAAGAWRVTDGTWFAQLCGVESK